MYVCTHIYTYNFYNSFFCGTFIGGGYILVCMFINVIYIFNSLWVVQTDSYFLHFNLYNSKRLWYISWGWVVGTEPVVQFGWTSLPSNYDCHTHPTTGIVIIVSAG